MFLSSDYFGLRGQRLNHAIVAIASIGFFLFGYGALNLKYAEIDQQKKVLTKTKDQGVTGSLLSLPSFTELFPSLDTINTTGAVKSHNARIQGTLVAIYEVGGAVGALCSLVLGSKFGRLKMIWMGHALIIIGAALQASSFQTAQLFAARVVTGVGTGINTATIPVWQSESSSPHNRGRYLMIEGAMITGGVCVSYWLDFGLHYVSGSASWRFPFAFQIIFALTVCLVILDLPESPRLLVGKGRTEEARKIHEALFPHESPETREAEFSAIVNNLQEYSEATWMSLLSNKNSSRNLLRCILAVAHSMFHQICGINLVIYYAPNIYQENLGMRPTQTRIINATVNGTLYFFTSFIATGLIERLGRRRLMMIGSTIMATGMAVAAVSSAFSSRCKVAAAFAAAFMFVIQAGFAIGWLAICWLYPAEIVPSQLRSQVNSITVTMTWLFNFLIVEVTPIMLDEISWRSYVIFAAINVAIGFTVFLWYPETAGISLEQVDEIFREGQSLRDVVRISLRRPSQSHRGEALSRPEDEKDMEDPNFCGVAKHVE